jgi:hypothetical protein
MKLALKLLSEAVRLTITFAGIAAGLMVCILVNLGYRMITLPMRVVRWKRRG